VKRVSAYSARYPGSFKVRALLALVIGSAAILIPLKGAPAAPGNPCAAPVDVIACENSKPGNPASDWNVHGAGDPTIQGFSTDISVNHGSTINFKIKTDAHAYTIDIYRFGWYAGLGARKIASINPSASLPQNQPACLSQTSTGLVDCGNWAVSASWNVPSSAVSGVYEAHLTRTDTGGDSAIFFVVRADESHSDLLYQTSDTAWQAYNQYGGNSLYAGNPAGRAYKVSYNRPFTTRDTSAQSFFFSGEFPMVRWLERNGYDVSYESGIDTARFGSLLLNHKTFLSVGHDEYWSAEQRANVEAARDAGVNLAFFSGNEAFWKTRWEPSIDGSNTQYRTLVSYKETAADAKIDPTATWTGTWRDPRFSPPSDGGRPENRMSGTIFMVNGYRADSITVSSAFKNLRIWRNTSIPNLAAGQTATFPAGTLGYEWDVDADNGFRPPGLIDLSQTTLTVPSLLQDYGSNYGTGTATHSLTLYKAASGALVFGAGTVQWAWGLDDDHDDISGADPQPPDSRMQQATVNLLADMGVQPDTLQSGVVPATKSTDTTAPTATITSPANGSSVPNGSTVTISGTASDVGGIVGGVEISVDGGNTWHPATGKTSWTYNWSAGSVGAVTIRARAVDDSGNISAAATSNVNVSCPCQIWGNNTTPETASNPDNRGVELGVKFRASSNGFIDGIRFYKGSANTGTHYGSLWTTTGTLLGRAVFTGESGSGWQQTLFDNPVAVTAGTTYVASYYAPRGGYSTTLGYFTSAGFTNPPLTALKDGDSGPNAVFMYSGSPTFPSNSSSGRNYWVDVLFDTTAAPDTKAPTVASTSPASGSTTADARGAVTANFSEAMDPATISSATFALRDSTNTVVPSTVAYNAASRSATLTPNATLAYGASYTATVSTGVKDLAGNAMAANYTWSFSTAPPKSCPCTLWASSDRPDVESNGDSRSLELGLKFRTDSNGYITGVRFYKSTANTGTHTGSLWTKDGTLLARATFTGESASGWQQVNFGGAIPVTADTTYVVSYFAPNGGYSYTRDYFTSAGFDNAPLRALKDGFDGVNGLYKYTSTSAIPDSGVSGTNYWVDPVFNRAAPPDSSAPTVMNTSPAAGSSNAAATTDVTATFSEPMLASSISGSTVSLVDNFGLAVPATVTYNATTMSAVLHPTSPLQYSATYTATVLGGASGVKDSGGNPMASTFTWSFSTKTCPCSIFPATATPESAGGPGNPLETGVRFQTTSNGYITGVRFYKFASNTGTHVGSLWTNTGTLLARTTFTNETASGWQTALFTTPVAVTANTPYVASYFSPSGGFSASLSYFTSAVSNPPLVALADGQAGGNGLFDYSDSPTFPTRSSLSRNYWVDVLYSSTPN